MFFLGGTEQHEFILYSMCFFFCTLGWMGTWTNILYTFTILNIFFRWGYFLRAKIGYQRILFFCRVSKFIWSDFCYPKAKHTGESMGNTFFGGWTIQQIQLEANVSHDTKHAAWQSQTKMQRAWVTACDIAGDCHMVAYISDHWIGINILKFFLNIYVPNEIIKTPPWSTLQSQV